VDFSFSILWPAIHFYVNLRCITQKWPLTFSSKGQNFVTSKHNIFAILLISVQLYTLVLWRLKDSLSTITRLMYTMLYKYLISWISPQLPAFQFQDSTYGT